MYFPKPAKKKTKATFQSPQTTINANCHITNIKPELKFTGKNVC